MPKQIRLVKARFTAVKKARSASKLQESLRLSSPLLSSGIASSHSHLDFPDSDTPMAPILDAEDSSIVILTRETRGRKRQKDEISESETSNIPARKSARKKPGPKPKPITTAKAPTKSKTKDLSTDGESDVEEVKKPKAKKKTKKTVDYDSDGVEVVATIARGATRG
ncbi:hypothetical protein K438DRAFT_1749454 [Mycena galopus ATCC 62051]|nr:hypothetical protein K438DRAFT_1749454 [Mycena galopus ATCC 62051]